MIPIQIISEEVGKEIRGGGTLLVPSRHRQCGESCWWLDRVREMTKRVNSGDQRYCGWNLTRICLLGLSFERCWHSDN